MIIWYIIRTAKSLFLRNYMTSLIKILGKDATNPVELQYWFSQKKTKRHQVDSRKKLLLRINRSPKKWNFPLLPILVDEFVGCSFEISFFFQCCHRNWCQNLISNEQPTNSSTRITLVLYTINLAIHRHK